MPLIEAACAVLSLFLWYVRRKMEIYVVDAFDFEIWREAKVVLGKLAFAENMYLRLDRKCRPAWQSVEVDTIVGCEVWISTVSKTASLLIGIKAT